MADVGVPSTYRESALLQDRHRSAVPRSTPRGVCAVPSVDTTDSVPAAHTPALLRACGETATVTFARARVFASTKLHRRHKLDT